MPKLLRGRLPKLPATLRPVPSSATVLTTKDTWIYQIHISNITATAATFTLKDAQGAPAVAWNAVSIEPNTVVVVQYPDGLLFASGLTWQAGTANALLCALQADYIPA